MAVQRYSSGAPLEEKVGYSRMVKAGPFVLIGGTTSVLSDGSVFGENDSYAQADYIFQKQVKLLEQAGASPEDVISVDIFLTPAADASEVGRAYTAIFHDVRPLCTEITIDHLNRPAQLMEIKMTAYLGGNK